ncbi:MAG TPA: hypothetical protein GXZ90_07745 [Clostridiales bacterium]|nr:hypothetical protein [Clostridiales bacterium]
MIAINIIIFLSYIILFVLSRGLEEKEKYNDKWYVSIFKDISVFIWRWLDRRKLFHKDNGVCKNIQTLNPGVKTEEIQKEYLVKKIFVILMIIFSFNIFSTLSNFNSNQVIINNSLMRPDYGRGSRKEYLDVYITPDINKNDQDKNLVIKDYSVNVNEKFYDDETLLVEFKHGIEYLETAILGENKSLNQICEDLFLPSSIPGTSIEVNWEVEDFSLLNTRGNLNNEDIDKDGIETYIKAILQYDENVFEHIFIIKVVPKQLNEKEKVLKDLNFELEKSSNRTKTHNYLNLPEKIEGYYIIWKEKDNNTSIKIIIFSLIIAVIMWFYQDQKLNDEIKKRRKQMMIDYPNIVSKFTLLVIAGMTIKQAWEKIVKDYDLKKRDKQLERRFAYEEMKITYNEVSVGVPESNAYETFGRRVGVLPYMKFSSLICQNLKRGNKGLSDLLLYEALSAFNDRKELAKTQAEEATTKMLLPMMLMFSIVLAIILIPAFISFNFL